MNHGTIQIPATTIELAPGEHFAGAIVDDQFNTIAYYVILLPRKMEQVVFEDAIFMAKALGGTLPTMQELALLYANLPKEFTLQWHWSRTPHNRYPSYSWCRDFENAAEDFLSKKHKRISARAVRYVYPHIPSHKQGE